MRRLIIILLTLACCRADFGDTTSQGSPRARLEMYYQGNSVIWGAAPNVIAEITNNCAVDLIVSEEPAFVLEIPGAPPTPAPVPADKFPSLTPNAVKIQVIERSAGKHFPMNVEISGRDVNVAIPPGQSKLLKLRVSDLPEGPCDLRLCLIYRGNKLAESESHRIDVLLPKEKPYWWSDEWKDDSTGPTKRITGTGK